MTASRVKEINPFIVMEVLERAHAMEKEGMHIIHLEVGEPDFDIPDCVKGAVCDALNEGRTHYTHSLGDPELRQAIAEQYNTEYGVQVDPTQIIITSGSSPAILMALSVLCDQNDEVIISDPAYACYANFIHYIGAKVVRVPVSPHDGFQFHAEDIIERISERTKAIIINSPMNPTGNLLTIESLKMMASLEVPIISDEIYHGLVYEQAAHSILEYTNSAFVVNGFSKRYAMTGLRLGYLIAPKAFIRTLQKMQQNLFICASSTAQRGGIAALNNGGSRVSAMVTVYNERRRYLIQRLIKMGFKIPVEPTGAFYVFVDASHLSLDSYNLAFEILEKAHVGVTPGIDFGPGGEGYLRFSYANSIENIKEGLDRLENFLHNKLKMG
ncbi:pyridoxal phosphate-dependent aminotransferase [Mangrovibacterium sp.]|uniref:pyridoxal phosphate-dependent aminotransferase n=1 Tax=Mangrovibacterium sp. TaxID=1961364 RepID=UPI00356502E5